MMSDYDQRRADAATLIPGGGGKLLSLIGSKRTFDVMEHLLTKASKKILMTMFTFDRARVVALCELALKRGVSVEVIADMKQTVNGSCRDQSLQVKALVNLGVGVYLAEGELIEGPYAAVGRTVNKEKKGVQHSKTVLADDHLLLGSCNMTISSEANQELNVLLQLDGEGLAAHERWFDALRGRSLGPVENDPRSFHCFDNYVKHFERETSIRQEQKAKSVEDRRYSLVRSRNAARASSVDRLSLDRSRQSDASM